MKLLATTIVSLSLLALVPQTILQYLVNMLLKDVNFLLVHCFSCSGGKFPPFIHKLTVYITL